MCRQRQVLSSLKFSPINVVFFWTNQYRKRKNPIKHDDNDDPTAQYESIFFSFFGLLVFVCSTYYTGYNNNKLLGFF